MAKHFELGYAAIGESGKNAERMERAPTTTQQWGNGGTLLLVTFSGLLGSC